MSTVKLFLLVVMSVSLFLVSEISFARHTAILIDANDGSVLHEVDATHSWYPASLTKLMTLYMTFTALNEGQIHLYDTLRTSHHASRQPNSKLGLRAGETLTVYDAILAAITRSANDAVVVLAEHLGGTEENFAVKMTAKAHALGMYDTHFMNATGLPHDWQVTTARDMAILAWKTQRHFPNYYPYFAARIFNFKGRELRGINKFTANYLGAEGMKTGFTCGSGYNLISSAYKNGRRLIGVVMGGMTSAERYQLMIKMMDDGFDNHYSHSKNITSKPTAFTGTPPYQLSCGSKASTVIASHSHSVSNYLNKKSKSVSKTMLASTGKKSSKSKKSITSHHAAKNKSSSKTKIAGNSKTRNQTAIAETKSKTSSKLASKTRNSKTRYRRG